MVLPVVCCSVCFGQQQKQTAGAVVHKAISAIYYESMSRRSKLPLASPPRSARGEAGGCHVLHVPVRGERHCGDGGDVSSSSPSQNFDNPSKVSKLVVVLYLHNGYGMVAATQVLLAGLGRHTHPNAGTRPPS